MISLCNFLAGGVIPDCDNVSDSAGIARNINEFAVHCDVSVVYDLTGLENCSCVSKSINLGLQTQFQQSQEVEAVVSVHFSSFFKCISKLFFEHSVVAADDLLCEQLLSVLGHSSVSKVWPMLSRRVWSFGARAFCLTPDVKADFSADVFFSSSVCRHAFLSLFLLVSLRPEPGWA